MHDDPTRIMGQPEDPGGRPHGNTRLFIAGLIAVIVGLVVAIVVIASDDGGDGGSTASGPEITLNSTTAETATAPTTTESAPTDTTTAPTTTETTTPSTTTAPTTTTEDENGSGGLPAP